MTMEVNKMKCFINEIQWNYGFNVRWLNGFFSNGSMEWDNGVVGNEIITMYEMIGWETLMWKQVTTFYVYQTQHELKQCLCLFINLINRIEWKWMK